MTKLERFFVALMFALLIAGVTYVMADAKMETKTPAQQQHQQQQKIPCLTCHAKFNDAWESGKHGHATNDPLFEQMWTDQGKPGACLVCHVTGYDPASGTWQEEGVACEACHGPVPAEHATSPTANPVPVDRTSNLCGRCHSDARFGWQEWQTSAHFQRAMTCTVCHDPHTAALKTVEGGEQKGPSGLCINCHREVSMAFPYSKHNQAGVSCVDCHLRHFEQKDNQDVHAMPDHSFSASLATCNTCHADQMHSQPADATASQSVPTTTDQAAATPGTVEEKPVPVTNRPAPVSPAGYAGLAGLLGLAGGMVLSPWLERLYHRMNKEGRKK